MPLVIVNTPNLSTYYQKLALLCIYRCTHSDYKKQYGSHASIIKRKATLRVVNNRLERECNDDVCKKGDGDAMRSHTIGMSAINSGWIKIRAIIKKEK